MKTPKDTLRITIDPIDPEDDIAHIETLPPAEQKWAVKYLSLQFKSLRDAAGAFLQAGARLRRPLWPKTEQTRAEWKKIYKVMLELDRLYADEHFKLGKPKREDYADAVAHELNKYGYRGKLYSARLLHEVRQAGAEGFLD